jgi:hypothetical protein
MACYITGSAHDVHCCHPTVGYHDDLNVAVHTSTTCSLHPHARRWHQSSVEASVPGAATGLMSAPHDQRTDVLLSTELGPSLCLQNRQQHFTCAPFLLLIRFQVASNLSPLPCGGCGECQRVQVACLQGSQATIRHMCWVVCQCGNNGGQQLPPNHKLLVAIRGHSY